MVVACAFGWIPLPLAYDFERLSSSPGLARKGCFPAPTARKKSARSDVEVLLAERVYFFKDKNPEEASENDVYMHFYIFMHFSRVSLGSLSVLRVGDQQHGHPPHHPPPHSRDASAAEKAGEPEPGDGTVAYHHPETPPPLHPTVGKFTMTLQPDRGGDIWAG